MWDEIPFVFDRVGATKIKVYTLACDGSENNTVYLDFTVVDTGMTIDAVSCVEWGSGEGSMQDTFMADLIEEFGRRGIDTVTYDGAASSWTTPIVGVYI